MYAEIVGHRLVTFALALALLGAPVAGDLCQIWCAHASGLAMTSSPAHHHHSALAGESVTAHHHHAAESTEPPTGHAIRSVDRVCSHLDVAVTATRDALRAPA